MLHLDMRYTVADIESIFSEFSQGSWKNIFLALIILGIPFYAPFGYVVYYM